MKNHIKNNNNNNKNSKLMSNCITNNHLKLKYNSISQIINHNMSKKIVDAHLGKAQ